ncbi:aromatic acid exporter family protein [Brevibacillus migulae]|uniref:aromatic acid exporter family protein n=1 Tax=Brevibacillus migulae TaxID=1644114 RepID=UPI00106E6494|nr:aromatic acid exporter family protein [Brevibacillus migulae]
MMMMTKWKIGTRIIKTAVGVALSVFLAQWAGLQFYTMAGVLTMLCIQVTRKKSLQTSGKRIGACFLGLLLSFFLFDWIGYHPATLFLTVIILLPLLVKLRLQDGVTTSMVVILQIYTQKEFTIPLFLNEMGLVGIGVGVALLMNLYMPKRENQMSAVQQKLESNFALILREFAVYLRRGESEWDGREMLETAELLEQMETMAIQNMENQLFRKDDDYYRTYSMRAKQFELLEAMLPIISSLYEQVPHAERLANFLDKLSEQIYDDEHAYVLLEELREMRKMHKTQPLPVTRAEFETRASLYHLFNEMEHFLMLYREGKLQQRAV